MSRFFALLFFLSIIPLGSMAQVVVGQPATEGFVYLIRPAFSVLVTTVQKPDDETLAVSMYGQLRSQFTFDVGSIHFKSYVNLDLTRDVRSDASPKTMRDELLVTFIPSKVIFPETNTSLFLELTMETRLTNGQQDGIPARLMDPAFFYETLYVGQWKDWKSDDNSRRLSIRYGVGYAFQQTMRNHFLLTDQRAINLDPENPLSAVRQAPSVKLESGWSLLSAIEFNGQLSEHLNSFVQGLAVALSKSILGFNSRHSHVVLQLGEGLTYSVFSLRYDFRLMYDPNYSRRRQLDQTATFGMQLEFRN